MYRLTKSIPAIILNSGYSTRLGEPKSLIQVSGKSLLTHAVERLLFAGCSPIVIVANKELQFDSVMNSNGATVVVNNNPENGRTGSLKVALNSIMTELGRIPNSVIMSPIDRPGWKSSHITQLFQAKKSSCLSQSGQKGHPVKLVKSDLLKIINAPDDIPLRDLVEFDNTEVADALLSLNIDTPEDLVELSKHSEFFDEL